MKSVLPVTSTPELPNSVCRPCYTDFHLFITLPFSGFWPHYQFTLVLATEELPAGYFCSFKLFILITLTNVMYMLAWKGRQSRERHKTSLGFYYNGYSKLSSKVF